MGWTNALSSIISANTFIVIGGASNSGIFVYSGPPANGNLIGSWTGQAGTDPYRNPYPEGLNVSLGNITGTNFNVDGLDAGVFLYNGTPTAGNLIGSFAETAGTDPFGNTFTPGLALGVADNTEIQIRPDLGAILIYGS